MHAPIAFFRFLAKAVINAAAGGLPVGDFIVDVLPEIGRDVWDAWAGPRTEAERRAEVEAVVLIPDSEAPSLAAEVVAEVAADQPEAVRQLVTGYLTMVPAAVRASLRRQTDPSGTTVPPDLVPRSANELIRLLPSRLPRFKPGDRPPGLDWELERFLGVGGFGEVWKARHVYQRSRSPTAVKFCNDPAAARLLRNEVELLDRLMGTGLHPGIVRLLDTHLGAEPYCLMYEYVEGGDLTGLIQASHRSGQGPTPSQAADWVRQLAEIIGTAHRLDPPIVHRDLKPANILVEWAADASPRFKITDFGIGGLYDPIAEMWYEYDRSAEHSRQAREGLAQYGAVVERVTRQVELHRKNVATLEAYLTTGDRETAAKLALDLKRAKDNLAKNEKQLSFYALVSRKKCTNPCSCETIVCTIPVASAAWCDRQA
jgi:eukaryotic-like serine/threonine-protein kinase